MELLSLFCRFRREMNHEDIDVAGFTDLSAGTGFRHSVGNTSVADDIVVEDAVVNDSVVNDSGSSDFVDSDSADNESMEHELVEECSSIVCKKNTLMWRYR